MKGERPLNKTSRRLQIPFSENKNTPQEEFNLLAGEASLRSRIEMNYLNHRNHYHIRLWGNVGRTA